MKVRVLVVDDEPLARERLNVLLDEDSFVEFDELARRTDEAKAMGGADKVARRRLVDQDCDPPGRAARLRTATPRT